MLVERTFRARDRVDDTTVKFWAYRAVSWNAKIWEGVLVHRHAATAQRSWREVSQIAFLLDVLRRPNFDTK